MVGALLFVSWAMVFARLLLQALALALADGEAGK